MQNLHKNHRKRLRERFLKEGLSSFPEHNILELLLFYSIPRADTNKTAHLLLEKFGNLAAVMDAPFEELCKVPGVGETSALLLKLVPEMTSAYLASLASHVNIIKTEEDAALFLTPLFIGEQDEVHIAVALDPRGAIINHREIARGSQNKVTSTIRDIFAFTHQTSAFSLILAHNHPRGKALPSREDWNSARELTKALRIIGVDIIDHMIFAGKDYFSMGPVTPEFGDF